MKTTAIISFVLIVLLAIPYSLVSALGNNYSSSTPLNTISLEIGGKILSGEEIQDLLDTATTKKYTKLGYIDGTPAMLQKKQEYYSKILKVLEKGYSSEKVHKKSDMKKLYEILYRVIEISHEEVENEYNLSLESPDDSYFKDLFKHTAEAEEINRQVQQKYDDEKEKIDATDFYEKKKEEYYERFSKTPHKFQDPNGDGFFSTGFSALDREVIAHAKNAVSAEALKAITDDYELQMLQYDNSLLSLQPSFEVHETGMRNIQRMIQRVEEGPKTTGYIGRQNGLIYHYIVDHYNLYIGTLIDGGLVKYPQEYIKELGFYTTYVQPFHTEENYVKYVDNLGAYKEYYTGTFEEYEREQNYDIKRMKMKEVLNYFGYSINIDKNSAEYLKLSYDPSKNKAKGQIDYIENIWR